MVRTWRTSRSSRLLQVVRRDGWRDDADDLERQVELCQIMWWMRHLVLAAALVHQLWDGRVGTTGATVLGTLALDITGHVVVTRRRSLTSVILVVDAAVLIGIAALRVPALLVFALAVAMLAWAATYRPVAAVLAYVGVNLAVWTSYVRHDEQHDATGFVAFSLLGAIFVVRMVRLNMAARRSAEQEHLVAQGVDAIVWEAIPDQPGGLKVSAAVERLLGFRVSEFERPGFLRSLVHPDDVTRHAGFERGDRRPDADVFRLRRADGEYRWFENHTSIVGDARSADGIVIGVLVDRTDEMATERNALALGHLMAGSPIGQMMMSRRDDGVVIDAINAACQSVLGLEGDALGRRLDECVGRPLADDLLALARAPEDRRRGEFRGANGRVYEATARRLDEVSCSIDFLDVTERSEHARHLHEQARQDDLTGLPNRRRLIEALEDEVGSGGGHPIALLMIDLDDFKDVNDALGHETGDRLLVDVARRLGAAVTEGELAARLGGDEFAVLLPGVDRSEAKERAAAIVALICQPVELGDLRLRVRASVGLAACPEDAADATELVRRADVAMYTAKQRSSSVEAYDPCLDPFDRDRLALAAELEDAIVRDELVLHHQPVIDVATGRMIGTEALVRWMHPRLGMVPPAAFIELAEVSGLIRPLTRWVVRQALSDLAGFGSDELEVSVNLSVRNLYEHDLVAWFATTLAQLSVRPQRLVVEITESMIMEDETTAAEVLAALRALGIRVWIDDFGTGHSSFARLRELPVDGVKVDRSFVAGAPHNDSDRIVLQSIVELVRSLDLESIAEGVEDEQHLELLRTLGCRTAQGYHIARPMPAGDLAAWMRARERPLLGVS